MSPVPWEPADEESIGDLRFSAWKSLEPMHAPEAVIRPFSLAVIFGAVLAFIDVSNYAIRRVELGDFGAAKLYGSGLITLLSVLMISVARRVHRMEKELPVSDPRPNGVPPDAIQVRVSLSHGDLGRGMSWGWLTRRGPWLVFQGDGFDFQIAHRDILKLSTPTANKSRRFRLKIPVGISPYLVTIAAEKKGAHQLIFDPQGTQNFASAFASWLESPEPSEPSLFPPLRRGFSPAKAWEMLIPFLPLAVISGLGAILMRELLHPYLDGQKPWALFLLTSVLVLQAPISTVALYILSLNYDKEVDRFQRLTHNLES